MTNDHDDHLADLKPTGSIPSNLPDPLVNRKFQWDRRRYKALRLMAESSMTLKAIAMEVGVSFHTVHQWKAHPVFRKRLDAWLADIAEEARRIGITRAVNRLQAAQNRHDRMQALIEARARAYGEDPAIPGGETGLVVESVKVVGKGDSAEAVKEYSFDASLMREMRELEKQVAQETGQWQERTISTVNASVQATVQAVGPDLSKLTVEELEQYRSLVDKTESDAVRGASVAMGLPLPQAEPEEPEDGWVPGQGEDEVDIDPNFVAEKEDGMDPDDYLPSSSASDR